MASASMGGFKDEARLAINNNGLSNARNRPWNALTPRLTWITLQDCSTLTDLQKPELNGNTIKPFCEVGLIEGTYDIVTCIEVIEHMSEVG